MPRQTKKQIAYFNDFCDCFLFVNIPMRGFRPVVESALRKSSSNSNVLRAVALITTIVETTASWLANGKAEYVTAEVSWNLMPLNQGSAFGNLSLVAAQTHTLQDMAGHINFPQTIPFPLLFVMFQNDDIAIEI